MVKINERAVEELVRDALVAEIEDKIAANLSTAVKERMAVEDVTAIADVIVADLVAPYVLKVAQSPHEVMMAALAPTSEGGRDE